MEKRIYYTKNPNTLVYNLNDVYILIETFTGIIANLNQTSYDMWNLCEQPISEEDLVLQLHELYDVDKETLKKDVREVLDALFNNKLIKEES